MLLHELSHFLPHSHEVGKYPHFIDENTEQGFKHGCCDSRPQGDLRDALHSWA